MGYYSGNIKLEFDGTKCEKSDDGKTASTDGTGI